MKPRVAFRLSSISALLGVLASVYLLYHHFEIHLGLQEGPSLCSINSQFDCDAVARSAYSEVFGIPVAGFGLFYFLVWALVLRAYQNRIDDGETWALFRALAVAGLIPVVGLLSISLTEVKSFCVVCLFTYAMTLLLGIAAFRVSAEGRRGVGFLSLGRFLLCGGGKNADLSTLFVLAVLGGATLIAPAFVLANHRSSLPPLTAEEVSAREFREWQGGAVRAIPVMLSGTGADFFSGAADAAHEIVVFSDFACPACRRLASSLEKLQKEFPIRIIFKNFPLDSSCNRLLTRPFHPVSCRAATIARCAKDGTDFWRLHDALFAEETLTEKTLEQLRGEVSQECLADSATLSRIREDVELGIELGLEGTPTVFINGRRVPKVSEEAIRNILRRIR